MRALRTTTEECWRWQTNDGANLLFGFRAHDFQYLEFAAEKYREDEPWILDHVGIPVAVMADIARKVKSYMNTNSRLIPELIAATSPKCVPFSCRYSASKLRTWPTPPTRTHSSRHFTNSRRCDVRLQVPGQYNELQARPIVELPDGRYFLPIAFNLSESIYESRSTG